MRDRSPSTECLALRRRLVESERPLTRRSSRHLERCADCRTERRLLLAIRQQLATAAEIPPSPELDDRMRRLLAVAPILAGSTLRPALATGLAVAAWIAFVGGAGSWLAAAGAIEMGPVYVGIGACAYLALCSAASLPLLLRDAVGRRGSPEVNP